MEFIRVLKKLVKENYYFNMYLKYTFDFEKSVRYGSYSENIGKENVNFASSYPRTCREQIIRELGAFFQSIRLEGSKQYDIPDFGGYSSIRFLSARTGNPANNVINVTDNPDHKEIITKLGCMVLEPLFGDRVYDIAISRGVKLIPSYSGGYESEILDVKFPSIFCLSPAILSIWISYLRKALSFALRLYSETHKEDYGKILPLVKEIKSFEDSKKIFRSMSYSVRDPFYNETKSKARYLCQVRTFDFYEFSLNYKESPNILDKSSWAFRANGYRTVCSIVYGDNKDMRIKFRDFLRSRKDDKIVDAFVNMKIYETKED